MWLPKSVKKFFVHSEIQTGEVFQDISSPKNILTPEPSQDIKIIMLPYNLVEMEFSPIR